MARVSFNLTPNPQFKAKVAIPIAGKKPELIEFTFRHRPKDVFVEFLKYVHTCDDDLDWILALPKPEGVDELPDEHKGACVGWELEDEFSRENLDKLFQNYPGSARAVLDKYIAEMGQARLGN